MSRASFAIGLSWLTSVAMAFSVGCSDTGDSSAVPGEDATTSDTSLDAISNADSRTDGRSTTDAKEADAAEKDSTSQDARLDSTSEAASDSSEDTGSDSPSADSPSDVAQDTGVACSGFGTGIAATPNTAAGSCPAGQDNTGTLKDSEGHFCCTQKVCFNGATEVGTGTEAIPNTAGGTCPTGQINSGTLTDPAANFCCSQRACFNGANAVGTGAEASPNTAAGTCAAGQSNSIKDTAGNFCCAQEACFDGATQVGTGAKASPNTAAGTCPAGQTNTGTLTDSAGNFCCSPATCVDVGTQTQATPDTAAGTCPAGQTNTGTLKDSSGNYCCSAAPCFNGETKVGTGTEATPNTAAGTCPASTFNNLVDNAGNFCCSSLLVPCTTAGVTGCVQCTGNASDTGGGAIPLCTPTEAQLVASDIKKGLITTAGPAPTYTSAADEPDGAPLIQSCYVCLSAKGCLDDNEGDTGAECEDGSFAAATTIAQCQATLSCILETTCNASAFSACYCGAATPSGTCTTDTTAVNDPVPASTNASVIGGSCNVEISTGLALSITDGIDVLKNIANANLAAGRAGAIFECGVAGKCTGCE